jgi:hypothetical protein
MSTRKQTMSDVQIHTPRRRRLTLTARAAGVAAMVALAIALPPTNHAQQVLDICGCADGPNLGNVNLSDDATFQGIATRSGETVTFTLPPDGVLRFDSLTTGDGSPSQRRFMRFVRNAANTPVTILVKGDMTMRTDFCCYYIDVSGSNGSSGSSSTAGVGGQGGPGGYRGGDGAAPAINGAFVGGAGFGPGGGAGAVSSATTISQVAGGGVFFGVPELFPLAGGSGGGGGTGTSAAASCSGGGGGGGGGAILIAVNGTLTLTNYDVFAEGGNGGSVGNGGCDRGGGGGSGGAIRLLAGRFEGNGRVFARGGSGAFASNSGTNGRIRFETVDSSAQTTFTASPAAFRVTGPSPVVNPVQPSVRITSIGGNAVPAVPVGQFGSIDINLPAPGDVVVGLSTSGVPSGTTVLVTVKPRIGAAPVSSPVPLPAGSCDDQGVCTAVTSFTLAAGAYVVEARATFQVGGP